MLDIYPNDNYPNDTFLNDNYPNDNYPNDNYPKISLKSSVDQIADIIKHISSIFKPLSQYIPL